MNTNVCVYQQLHNPQCIQFTLSVHGINGLFISVRSGYFLLGNNMLNTLTIARAALAISATKILIARAEKAIRAEKILIARAEMD